MVAGGQADTTVKPAPQPVPERATMVGAPAQQVFAALRSSPRGLPAEQAAERRRVYGPNELPRAARRRIWWRLAAQFTDLFAIVLLVASAIMFLAYALREPREPGPLQLAIAILCVVLLNAVIGFAQEYSAERTAEALQAMVPRTCRVLRDGERCELAAGDLVPGDVLVLEAGDAVPADGRLVEALDLTVNNAALTGESEPVARTDAAEPGLPEGPAARNCVFMGTTVATGTGKAVVYATAAATEFGQIYRMTQQAPQPESPLQRQIVSMARRVASVALLIGAAMFLIRLPAGQPVVATFVFALGVMVALVPEGLPATMSVSLAIGVRRMARRNALVKRLLAVEALGSTTVICTDKTGTLTKAEMTVTQVWASGVGHPVSGVGYAPQGHLSDPEPVRELLRALALCSDARLLPPSEREGWRVLGDTTEGALLVAAAKAGLDLAAEREARPRTAEFPFDSVRKLMTTVNEVAGDHVCYVKGAPAELLARCTAVEWDGREVPLTGELRERVLGTADELAGQGLRVLAAARRAAPGPRPAQRVAESELTLLGLVGMLDPPRPEVAAAVAACRRAGIRIVMVSGDHPLTVEAVARRVGIVAEEDPVIVSGRQLDRLDEDGLDALLAASGPLLCCRVDPEHKMRVVTALQRRGEVVAVTGDGANDAPALKGADIGVAMGASGTDVAREAAVMVLLDDSFASVAAAVELGRSVYQNIRKFLVYVFTSNVGELVPIVVAAFCGFPLVPLLAVQILAIDLGTDVLPALALGAEPPEPDTMDRPPRSRKERLMSLVALRRILFLGLIQAAGATAVFFWHINASGIPYEAFTENDPVYREAITLVHAAIVVSQFFVSLAVRTDRQSLFRVGVLSNPRLLGAGAIGLTVMMAIAYLPPLQTVFHTAPLAATDWAVLILFGVVLLAAEEARKWWLRRRDVKEASA